MCCMHAGMYVCPDDKPSAMSRQTCSMQELCTRLLALAVAGRAPQGHTPPQQQQQQQQPNGDAAEAADAQQQPQQQQQQQQEGEQRRSLTPEVKVHVGVEAVAQQLRQSRELSTRMGSSKLDLEKDLTLASQVRGSYLALHACWGRVGSSNAILVYGQYTMYLLYVHLLHLQLPYRHFGQTSASTTALVRAACQHTYMVLLVCADC